MKAVVAQLVERVLGKDEVTSSILVNGSRSKPHRNSRTSKPGSSLLRMGCVSIPRRTLPILRPILWIVFAAFSVILLARAAGGELTAPNFSLRSPLNAESFVAVSFLLLVLLRAQKSFVFGVPPPSRTLTPKRQTALVASVLLLCLVAFAHSLSKPLLFDDYGHVTFASQSTWHSILAAFYQPRPDIFFRPMGFFSYFLDFQWTRFDPFRWHLSSLAMHMLNCVLVYVLTRQLRFSWLGSIVAAAVFAIHGTRAEPVCWTDARFDVLSTFFVLSCLVLLERYLRKPGPWWLAGSYLVAALALFTKEAAFALPLIILALALFHDRRHRRRLLRTAPGMFALAVVVFLYRLWIIKGIGGYQTNGHPDVFIFSALRSAKALLWRLWGISFFPLNWSSQPSVAVMLLLIGFLVVLAAVAARAPVHKPRLLGAILLVPAASVPVQHLLLIGSDFAGARISTCRFSAWPCSGRSSRRLSKIERPSPTPSLRSCCVSTLPACKGISRSGRRSPKTARSACQAFGRQIANVEGPVGYSMYPSSIAASTSSKTVLPTAWK